MKKKMLFSVLIVLALLIPTTSAFAGFSIKYEADENGNMTIPYFSFAHWSAWEQAGGYVEVVYRPDPQGSEFVKFTRPATDHKIYMQYNGLWTFYPKLADGSQAGSTPFFQFLITKGKNYNNELGTPSTGGR